MATPPRISIRVMTVLHPDAPATTLSVHAHPLTSGLEFADAWRADGDGFALHTGFAALVGHPRGPATLIVGDHGRGQFVLTALPLDRPLAEGAEQSPLAERDAIAVVDSAPPSCQSSSSSTAPRYGSRCFLR